MKKVNQEGNILFLSQNRPKTFCLTSYEIDRKIEEIMFPKVLSASSAASSGGVFDESMTGSISRKGNRFTLLKLMACFLLFVSLVLSTANLALLAMIPQVSAGALGVLSSIVILMGCLFAFAVRHDHKTENSHVSHTAQQHSF